MCKDTGISPGVMTDLKKGRRHSVKAETAARLANYFDVSVDYLLGNTDQKEKAPAKAEADDVTFDDFTYAFHNEAKDLSVEEKNALLEMAKALKRAKEGK